MTDFALGSQIEETAAIREHRLVHISLPLKDSVQPGRPAFFQDVDMVEPI